MTQLQIKFHAGRWQVSAVAQASACGLSAVERGSRDMGVGTGSRDRMIICSIADGFAAPQTAQPAAPKEEDGEIGVRSQILTRGWGERKVANGSWDKGQIIMFVGGHLVRLDALET